MGYISGGGQISGARLLANGRLALRTFFAIQTGYITPDCSEVSEDS